MNEHLFISPSIVCKATIVWTCNLDGTDKKYSFGGQISWETAMQYTVDLKELDFECMN